MTSRVMKIDNAKYFTPYAVDWLWCQMFPSCYNKQPALNESRQSTLSTTGSVSSGSGHHSSATLLTDPGSDVHDGLQAFYRSSNDPMVLSLPPLPTRRPLVFDNGEQRRRVDMGTKRHLRNSFHGVFRRSDSPMPPRCADRNIVLHHKVNKESINVNS